MSRGKQNRQDMAYSENVVKFKLDRFKLVADEEGHYGSFEIIKHCITKGEDPDSHVKDKTTYYINNKGEMSFSFGRKGSEEVAKWWISEFSANNTTFDHDPDELNFAALGDLMLNVQLYDESTKKEVFKSIVFENVGIAQGHAGASNNWWFGGKNMHYIGNNEVIGESTNEGIALVAHRGGNSVNEINLRLQTYIKWISKLQPETRLCDLSIPGTHDSGTSKLLLACDAGPSHCQNFNIMQQLNDGIRFFDIRIGYDLRLNHGGTLSNEKWNDAMNQIIAFLKINPYELVFVLVGSETAAHDWSEAMKDAIKKYKDYYLSSFSPLETTIEAARGKIILLKRQDDCPCGLFIDFSDNTTFDSNGFKIEDCYNEHDTNEKSKRVEENLNLTLNVMPNKYFFVTFNSIAAGAHTPYQYAWGGSGVSPSMNQQLIDYLNKHPGKHNWGAILMDFYNDEGNKPDLIKNIINSNFVEALIK